MIEVALRVRKVSGCLVSFAVIGRIVEVLCVVQVASGGEVKQFA